MKKQALVVPALLTLAAVPAALTSLTPSKVTEQDLVTKIGDGVYWINDRNIASAYVVCGTERCLVIDSGVGTRNFHEMAVHVSHGLPMECALTHGHVDHAGAAKQFPVVYLDAADEGLKIQQSLLVRKVFGCLNNLATLKTMGGFQREISNQSNIPSETILIEDGWCRDLGGRTVTFHSLPGHTPGSGCFVDSKTGFLFAGDMATPNIWMQFPESTNISTLLDSEKKLYEIEKQCTQIWTGHQEPDFLCTPERTKAMIELADRALHGPAVDVRKIGVLRELSLPYTDADGSARRVTILMRKGNKLR